MTETTTKTPGILSRLVEVMAPESKGAQSVARGAEDAVFAALLANQAQFATHMIAGGADAPGPFAGGTADHNLSQDVAGGISAEPTLFRG